MSQKTALEQIRRAIRDNATTLDLSGNQLTTLPIEITQLQNLTTLDLSGNQLTTLPTEIAQLQKLTTLNLMSNGLTTLPTEIAQLQKLTTLYLSGNPLQADISVAYRESTEALFDYLRLLEREGEPVNEVKLVLVGAGDVGKTTLREALLGHPPQKGRGSTEGVEVSHASLSLPQGEGKPDINVTMWDFGWQERYQVSHQFYFSKNTLYLLVWDPRSGAEKCDVEGWLERIQLRVGDEAKVLLVASYAGDKANPPKINEDYLRGRFPKLIVDFYSVEGVEYLHDPDLTKLLENLKTAITELAIPFAARKFPRTWQKIRQKVIALKAEHTCLKFSEFAKLCTDEGLPQENIEQLATTMNEVGDFVYFSNPNLDSAAFEDDNDQENILVLQPEWLAKAIAFLLNDPAANRLDNGVLPHTELSRIWNDPKRPENERYSPNLHPYFLWLMEEFFISYRLHPNKTTSLVPQLITEVRPDDLLFERGTSAPPTEREVNLICRLEQNPPPGIVPQMIVACHNLRTPSSDTRNKNWKQGAFFATQHIGNALMELRDRELWFTARSGYPYHLAQQLRKTLETRIENIWSGLEGKYSIVVPCPTERPPHSGNFCKGRFKIEALQSAKQYGMKAYLCQECNLFIPVAPLLEGLDYSSTAETMRLLEELRTQTDMLNTKTDQSISLAWDIFNRLMVAIGTESREAPCMFSLFPYEAGRTHQNYNLTLWCEWHNTPHPVVPIGTGLDGDYKFSRPKEWYTELQPYLKALSLILKVFLPIAENIGGAASLWTEDAMKYAKPYLESLEKTEPLIKPSEEREGKYDTQSPVRAEGEALRMIHDLLQELGAKKGRKWGGLTRFPTRSGEYIWLCSKHAIEFSPGLPVFEDDDTPENKILN